MAARLLAAVVLTALAVSAVAAPSVEFSDGAQGECGGPVRGGRLTRSAQTTWTR